jgi:hypothetical protein
VFAFGTNNIDSQGTRWDYIKGIYVRIRDDDGLARQTNLSVSLDRFQGKRISLLYALEVMVPSSTTCRALLPKRFFSRNRNLMETKRLRWSLIFFKGLAGQSRLNFHVQATRI